MNLLITGSGRCGTGYVAMVLRSVGIRCGHEDVFGLAGWKHVQKVRDSWQADSSWLAVPFLDCLTGVKVVHLVRNPKDTINSMVNCRLFERPGFPYARWLRHYLPSVDDYEEVADKAAHWYIEWNKCIEPFADVFHRVEDDAQLLLQKLSIDHEGKELFADKKCNTYPGNSDVQLSGLERADDVMAMAERYGYALYS